MKTFTPRQINYQKRIKWRGNQMMLNLHNETNDTNTVSENLTDCIYVVCDPSNYRKDYIDIPFAKTQMWIPRI